MCCFGKMLLTAVVQCFHQEMLECSFYSVSSVSLIVQLSKRLNPYLAVEPTEFRKHLYLFPHNIISSGHRKKHRKRFLENPEFPEIYTFEFYFSITILIGRKCVPWEEIEVVMEHAVSSLAAQSIV